MSPPARWRSIVAATVVAQLLAACQSDGGGPVPVDDFGYGSVAFHVHRGTKVSQWCALLADTEEERARGLMQRRDLGGFDAMLFRFDADTEARFHMTDTPLPLSIAWFARDGRFVSSADMEPCLDTTECPRYSAAGPYRFALEVPQGELDDLGVGAGVVVSIGASCDRR